MRENKKTLKLRKFKIANLDTFVLKGGTDTSVVRTTPQNAETDTCSTLINTQCTIGQTKTDVENTCSERGDGLNDTN